MIGLHASSSAAVALQAEQGHVCCCAMSSGITLNAAVGALHSSVKHMTVLRNYSCLQTQSKRYAVNN